LTTGVIKAKEERDVMTCDIPNKFIQAYLPKKEPGEDRVVVKITGVLVNMLVGINPELYRPAVVLENRKKVLYVEVLKPYTVCWKQPYCGIRHLERILKTLDLFSTPTTQAWQIRKFKDCNRQSYFMWPFKVKPQVEVSK
jgi:hypothetical protein